MHEPSAPGTTGRIHLAAGDASVELDPDAGGRIATLRVGDLDLIGVGGEGPMRWGAYPMVPWAGRLRDGLLRFGGSETRFPLAMPPHAIHGTTWDRPWTVVEAGPSDATLAIELGLPWPFGGRAVHRVELGARALRATLEVHAGERPMPAIVGWHPWFLRRLARGGPVEIELQAGGMLVRGADGLPTGEVVPVPPPPWDDAFVAVEQPVRVRWPGALELEIESDHAPCWVVYTEMPLAVCVEPQTGPPNGLATGEYTLVEPGRPLLTSMTIAWRAPEGG